MRRTRAAIAIRKLIGLLPIKSSWRIMTSIGVLPSISARNSGHDEPVVFEVANETLVLGDDLLENIANGENADDSAVIANSQMAYSVLAHQSAAFLNRVAGRSVEDRTSCHDLMHENILGRLALQFDPSGVVTLGEDPFEFTALEHHAGPDVFLLHQLEGA